MGTDEVAPRGQDGRLMAVLTQARDLAQPQPALEQSHFLVRQHIGEGPTVHPRAAGAETPGGNAAHAKIPLGPGYQVQFAEKVRRETGMPTGAVGLITSAAQAEEIVGNGQADMVLLAREFLRDPYFALHAALSLGEKPAPPPQYLRAF